MTTPQSQLYNLSDKINHLTKLFEGKYNDEGQCEEESVFETIQQMQRELFDLVNSHQRIENQLALIIKLLGKNV